MRRQPATDNLMDLTPTIQVKRNAGDADEAIFSWMLGGFCGM